MTAVTLSQELQRRVEQVRHYRLCGDFVQAHETAIGLLSATQTSAPGSEPAEPSLLHVLSLVYVETNSHWGTPYPLSVSVSGLSIDSTRGHPKFFGLLMSAAEREREVGASSTRMTRLLAAATVFSDFGTTGFARRELLCDVWEQAKSIGRLDEALVAASAYAALCDEDDDVLAQFGQDMLATSLMDLGRDADAIPVLERVVEIRRRMDVMGKRRTWVVEAELRLARLRP